MIKNVMTNSVWLYQVGFGRCNKCSLEICNMFSARYCNQTRGLRPVSWPSHADVLMVSGTSNSCDGKALTRIFDTIASPKAVIGVGSCALNKGVFQDDFLELTTLDKLLPVDVFIPGCPPRPEGIIAGIKKMLNMYRPESR